MRAARYPRQERPTYRIRVRGPGSALATPSAMRLVGIVWLALFAGCGAAPSASDRDGSPDAVTASLDAAAVSDSATSPDAASALPSEMIDWVAGSGWVFEATVVRLNDCTEELPPWDPGGDWDLARMIVVRIDGVALAPESAPLVVGTEHTVVLPEPPTMAVGARAFFFVTWLGAGESWVFQEVGQLSEDAVDLIDLTTLVEQIETYLADRAVYERMLAADRVVEATVLDAKRLPGPEVDNLPIWWEAQVEVTSALSGPALVDRPVRFDGATSYCCYQRPKLAAGEQAILALFPDDQSGADGDGFLIIDPLDKWAPAEYTHLESLLETPPEPPL